jgi:hypothetical protein
MIRSPPHLWGDGSFLMALSVVGGNVP